MASFIVPPFPPLDWSTVHPFPLIFRRSKIGPSFLDECLSGDASAPPPKMKKRGMFRGSSDNFFFPMVVCCFFSCKIVPPFRFESHLPPQVVRGDHRLRGLPLLTNDLLAAFFLFFLGGVDIRSTADSLSACCRDYLAVFPF